MSCQNISDDSYVHMLALKLMFVIAVFVFGLLLVILSALGFLRHKMPQAKVTRNELPSLSLLIPARNETHTVARALTAATALNYPKLEIIVLDDQSQDNTSEKIRSFAQDGVRFIKGEPLPKHWVGKNWAMQQLSEQASGEYILFCDVDVRLSSQGLTRFMRNVASENLAGASIQPKLIPSSLLSAALFPFLIWSTQLLGTKHPKVHPSYGGLQLYRKDHWLQHGGFKRYKNDLLAEFMLAKNFHRIGGFKFYRNNKKIDISYVKSQKRLDQARMRYLRTMPSTSTILFMLHTLCVVLPLLLLIYYPLLYPIIVITAAMAMINISRYWLLSALLLPIAAVYELIIALSSFALAIFKPATWKSRKL